MIHAESHLEGVGGLRIYWQSWLPDSEARAAVVIAHGAGEHSGRYPHVATALVADGYAVYALDHRGHGRSEGSRALLDRMDNAVADLDSLVVLVGQKQPGRKIFLLGHSMGGAISVCYAIRHQDRLAGLILSAPLAALEAASPPLRVIAQVLSAVTPRLPLVAVDASLVSRDPAVVSAYVSDPLVHHGKLPVRTVAVLAAAIESFPEGARAIKVPTLILYGTGDRLVPPHGSVMLSERISSADRTIKSYEGLYHEILNEPEQRQVLDEIRSWLVARVAAVPA